MNNIERSIGVFDSGMGGLTVLKALKQALPNESFIYLGDTARLPYGTKSPETIRAYAEQLAKVLVERHIKALVIACNTASTAALPHLQKILPDLPIIGVVEPGANAALKATRNGKVMVLATQTTIASKAYQAHIQAKRSDIEVKGQACSLLVALAEEGMVDNAIAISALEHYLKALEDEDTILLGCTHFPVFKETLKKLLPKDVEIVDSAIATSEALKQVLKDRNLLNPETYRPQMQYLVTDSVERFRQVSPIFLGAHLAQDAVELIDAHPNIKGII